jgi:hypothetical protein
MIPDYVEPCDNCGAQFTIKGGYAASFYAPPEGHPVEINPEPTKLTGGSSDYYKVRVDRPTSGGEPYMAECNDIIEALAMEYDVANAFKAAWRVAALRQGRGKPGQDSAVYDGEKIVFFGQRIIERAKP